jgi:hypothetical protein
LGKWGNGGSAIDVGASGGTGEAEDRVSRIAAGYGEHQDAIYEVNARDLANITDIMTCRDG